MDQALSDAIASLSRRYGAGVVHFGERPDAPVSWLTGVPAIDEYLTPGGLPQGRLTVLAGRGQGPTGRLTLLQALTAVASQSIDVAYVDLMGTLDPGFLADLGAKLDSCMVVVPGRGRWGDGLAMARSLVRAGMPWLGIALGPQRPRDDLWGHALSALGQAVWKGRTVCVAAALSPLPLALAHASSLTLECTSFGWQEFHDDVVGLRMGLTVVKSRLTGSGGNPSQKASILLRYPRLFAPGKMAVSTLMREPPYPVATR